MESQTRVKFSDIRMMIPSNINRNVTRKRVLLLSMLLMIIFLIVVYHNFLKETEEDLTINSFLPIYLQHEPLLLPKNQIAAEDRDLAACFVMSEPSNRQKRDNIRQTWGKLANPIFILGKSNFTTMKMVYNEAKKFNDIIVEDFIDSPENLTIKTAFAMKSFIKFFPNSKYFLKVEDDVFLNAKHFNDFMENVPEDNIVGLLAQRFRVVRDKNRKGYVPRNVFEDDTYPDFVLSPLYMIPGKMILQIFSTSMTIPYFKNEDVFFTGVVAVKALNYTLHHAPEFSFYDPKRNATDYLSFIAVHALPQKDFASIWEIIESSAEDDW